MVGAMWPAAAHVHRGDGEKSGRRLRLVQQLLHLGLKRGITRARGDQGRRALVHGAREYLEIQRLDAAPALSRHPAIIGRRRRACASDQWPADKAAAIDATVATAATTPSIRDAATLPIDRSDAMNR